MGDTVAARRLLHGVPIRWNEATVMMADAWQNASVCALFCPPLTGILSTQEGQGPLLMAHSVAAGPAASRWLEGPLRAPNGSKEANFLGTLKVLQGTNKSR